MPDETLQGLLTRLMNREDLSRREAAALLGAMLDGEARDTHIAAALAALATKGETIEELAGLVEALRARAVRLKTRHRCFIDTAGTGSSSAKTFNISTAAAFVIAGAGLPVAKHGNRAATSRSGSADVLTTLGVNVSAPPHIMETCLNELGICFMFAPLYHGATARVAGIRRELGIRTTFNLLGPLSNPAGAPRQIVGVWNRNVMERLAQVLAALGTEWAWVVHGEDGLDEITLAGKTLVAEARGGQVRTFEIEPQDFGLWRASLGQLRCDDAQTSARLMLEVLSCSRRDEARALVVVNAAAALLVGGRAGDLVSAASLAEQALDSGAGMLKLNELIQATNA
jgi:anthranilate phosphoribosyltransferase